MTNKIPRGEENYLQSAIKAGLSGKAAAVYVTLLRAGTSLPPKQVILQTRLHRQYVYDALGELKSKSLISTDGSGRRIRYVATSPDRLAHSAEKVRIDVLDGVDSLMHLYDRSPAGVVEIIRGKRAVIESELDQIRSAKDGDFLDIIGGAGMKFVHMFGDNIETWEQLREKSKVQLRYIGTREDALYNWTRSIVTHESRVIPNIRDLINVSIRPDSVSFNFYEPEILIVRVKNKGAVESQRALFEILWGLAQKEEDVMGTRTKS